MKNEFISLKSLLAHPGWAVLEAEWMAQVTKIEEARDKAAKRGSDSAWRYWAGQEFGFKLAITAAQRTLDNMAKENEALEGEARYESLLSEIKGEKV